MRLLAIALLFCPGVVLAKSPEAQWTHVEKRLRQAGLKSTFIKDLKRHYEDKDFLQVVELNVLLYLRKSDYHGIQVSDDAIGTIKNFMSANQAALTSAETRFGVPASVVASLLWLESRHGQNQGRFHVPSVYLHLVQAPRPEVVRHLHEGAKRFTSAKITAKIRQEITRRTKTKADWALAELKALQSLHGRDKALAQRLRGSFSGAFGMAQFLPSSYLRWARPAHAKRVPDLSCPADAIHSVAFYLKDNGWRKKPSTHVPALLKYNKSVDYANAILTLARKVDPALVPTEPRTPASRPKTK